MVAVQFELRGGIGVAELGESESDAEGEEHPEAGHEDRVRHSQHRLALGKHQRAVEAIFAWRANIAWTDIEAMLLSYGAEMSRVRIALNSVHAVFHRPHPQKETVRGAVASMRRFLVGAGAGVERKS